jgi:hypothetical protein
MTTLRFFVEYHSAQRRPVLEFWLNGQQLTVQIEQEHQVNQYQTNAVVKVTGELLDRNIIEIWQRDKTDHDMVQHNGEWIDHWCKVQEIEIDGIACQTALYLCSEFEHAMSTEWVARMQSQGHAIEKIYRPGGTDIRLNGCCRLHFTTPVWQWYITNYDNERTN